MRRLILLVCVTLALLCFACGSLVNPQLPPSQEPLDLVDAGNGKPIEETVILVPIHDVALGVSTSGGHGPGWVWSEEALVAPFLYRHGERLQLTRPRSFGFLFGPGILFAGRGAILKGVIAISRTHRALWVWALWDRSLGEPFAMQPLAEPAAYAARLLQILDGGVIKSDELTREEQDTFSLIPGRSLVVAFGQADRTLVRDYLHSGS